MSMLLAESLAASDLRSYFCRFTRQNSMPNPQPTADANQDPSHSTSNQGSQCVLNTKSQHLKAIV